MRRSNEHSLCKYIPLDYLSHCNWRIRPFAGAVLFVCFMREMNYFKLYELHDLAFQNVCVFIPL